MGLLSTYYKLKEYLKIHKYKFSEEILRQKIFWELIRNRWRSLFTLIGLITVCFLLDILFSEFLVPFITMQPWYVLLIRYLQFPDAQIIISLLSAIVESIAAVIGLLLSISLVVLELAANRYPYRMVRFLIEEKVGTYIVDLLITTLLFSLWTLFLLQRGATFPYISILVCLLLASLSIVFLFVYRKYSLYFFQPHQGFLAVSHEVRREIYAVFEKSAKLGISVTGHLQRIVLERIFLMEDFINVLIDKKDSEADYGIIALLSILSLYIEGKRFIDVQSGWFPSREVPVHETDYVSLQLTQPFEELALGTRTKQEPDANWLERQILDVIDDVQRKMIEKNDRKCISALLSGYKEVIEKCFEHQEFSILDQVIEQVSRLGIETSVKGYPEVTNEFYNLILLVTEKSIRGSDLQFIRDVLRKISWLSDEEILSLKLPKVSHEELLSYRKKLETELIIEGRILTPSDWIEEEVIDKISRLDADLSRKYYGEALTILSNVHEKVSLGKCHSEIRNALVVQLQALRRALVLGKNLLVSENIDGVSQAVLKSYKDLGAEKEMRLDIFKELKLGCLNCFYTSSKSFKIVEDLIFKSFNVGKLIKLFEKMTSEYDPRLTLKYHNWFKDIILKRSKLPMVEKKRKGFRGLDIVYDHPSEFIQRSFDIGIMECARAMIQKLAELINQQA